MTLNVTNCPKCGRIMMKGIRAICPNCHQEIELQYEKCLKFLRDNKRSSLVDLSEATGVSVNQITKFIREGRISIADLPNMGIACEICGTPTRDTHMCDSCRQRFVKDVQGMKEDEQRRSDQRGGTGFLKDR